MKHKTTEDYLWELKLSIIKAIPVFLTASLAFSQIFSLKEFARNTFLLLTFTLLLIFLLAVVEVLKFGVSERPRKKRKTKGKTR